MHKFNCEMDLARTYLKHGKLALAFECADAAWDAAHDMADSHRMQEADELSNLIVIANAEAA